MSASARISVAARRRARLSRLGGGRDMHSDASEPASGLAADPPQVGTLLDQGRRRRCVHVLDERVDRWGGHPDLGREGGVDLGVDLGGPGHLIAGRQNRRFMQPT